MLGNRSKEQHTGSSALPSRFPSRANLPPPPRKSPCLETRPRSQLHHSLQGGKVTRKLTSPSYSPLQVTAPASRSSAQATGYLQLPALLCPSPSPPPQPLRQQPFSRCSAPSFELGAQTGGLPRLSTDGRTRQPPWRVPRGCCWTVKHRRPGESAKGSCALQPEGGSL